MRRTGRFPLTSSLTFVALLLRHCIADEQSGIAQQSTVNSQSISFSSSKRPRLENYSPVQPIEAMKTCLGDTYSPNLHLFSSQLLSKFSDKLAHLLVRHVTGGLWPPTSTGRQRLSGLH
jgi:hypothetical protein